MSGRPKYLRFVVHKKHWRSGRRSGLFQALDEIADASPHLKPALSELSVWFDKNLSRPFLSDEKKQRSRDTIADGPKKIAAQPHSISWIKDTAYEHVSKLQHLKALVEDAGWMVEEIRTARPGKILYEDEFQVVALPYSDTPT